MDTEVVVIGAGVIGLAIAREIASFGYSVILLEKEAQYGCGISSRNTEVIHSGIYYQAGSLKASLCVKGKSLLYEHCARYKIKHKRLGKIILAVTRKEVPKLELIKKQALKNGVRDVVELDRNDIKKLESEISGRAALFSPSSGIFDTHSFMKSLLKLGEADGMIFAPSSPVIGAEPLNDGWKVRIGGNEPASVVCRLVVNTAGLYSVELSKSIFPDRNVPRLYPKKGSYARYSGNFPLNHIVYPALIPGAVEERVDMTPDLEGMLRFGPTTEEPKNLEDFNIVANLIEKIAPSLRRYLPGLDISRIHPDCAGIRPRIFGAGEDVQDFRFEWAPEQGWLDLWGIESPGLTASLAIAEHAYGLISERDIL